MATVHSLRSTTIRPQVEGFVRRLLVKAGDRVQQGQVLAVMEAMKMELAITAPSGGELIEMRCAPGALVQPGQVLAVLR